MKLEIEKKRTRDNLINNMLETLMTKYDYIRYKNQFNNNKVIEQLHLNVK